MNFVIKEIILLFLIFTALALPQNSLHDQYDYAMELFKNEKYFDTITELKRLQFFDSENTFAFKSNLLIGKSYKAGGKFDEAAKYFTLAEINAKDDDEIFTSKIFNARTNILRRTSKQAERILNTLLEDPKFISRKNEINYWIGWNYIFSNEWDKAYQIFFEADLDTSLANLCYSVTEQMYSEKFAKYSSYIIPGFGQFYTGEYLSGTLSLGWNVLFGFFTINSFVEDRVFDGIIIGNLLWLRFYSGNTQNAEKFAVQKNLKISNKALEYLQSDFAGERP